MSFRWPALSVLAVVLSVAMALGLRAVGLAAPVLVLVLALGVAGASLAGRTAGLVSSLAVVLAFNYWFTEPLYTLFVSDAQNYAVFFLLLAIGILIGTLTDRLRRLARDHVLQGFSHDLRTPLTVIGGTAASLRVSLAGRVEGHDLERLAAIERETGALDRQLENLLTLARLTSGVTRGSRERIPAEELLYSCRDRWAWKPGRVEVSVPEDSPLVRADAALLERALLNLVENADRYAPPGSAVVLSFAVVSGFVEFRVADRGPGVPESERKAVFQRYVRGRGAKGRGTGLGLALVAETAKSCSGAAGVRGREGGGAEFWIRVPVSR